MDNYLNQWISIIEKMKNANTYKVMWGKAILEVLKEEECHSISFEQLAHKMMGYYWDLEFFFGMKQAPQVKKTPKILQIVREMIYEYKCQTSSIPEWYIKAEKSLKKHPMFHRWVRRTVAALKVDVSEKFMNLSDGKLPIYELNKKSETIVFTSNQWNVIRTNIFVLSQLFNYKLAQLLEQYNDSPRITQKVRGLSDQQLRRSSLKKYKDILLSITSDQPILDFYTGEVLEQHDISLDHVIPWSFIYSDDIWNLVVTSKSNNSKKSNLTPSKEMIKKLQARNEKLLESNISSKYKEALRISIEQNYPMKFLNRMQ
jgi:hypothetical protein